MDLEKLNTSQIVLLTLLVSFVTSIATGIVTVSLMEQAPPAVTQTVNRIVERTVEKVSPEALVAAAAPSQTQTETIVIRESDLLATAIETVAPSVVRIYAQGRDERGNEAKLFFGHAIVIESSGILIADAGTPDGMLSLVRPDGVEVTASVIARPERSPIVRLQAATTSATQEPIIWSPARIVSHALPLGKAVVAIGGRNGTKIAQGIIIATSVGGTDTGGGYVETDIPADAFAAGSPLLDANGDIVAVATRESRAAAPGGFLASSAIILDNKTPEPSSASPNN